MAGRGTDGIEADRRERRSAVTQRRARRRATRERRTALGDGTDRRNEDGAGSRSRSNDAGVADGYAGRSLVAAAPMRAPRAGALLGLQGRRGARDAPTARIVTGCNVENATYGLTMCAERVALVKALSEGHDVFTRIAVVADTDAPRRRAGRAASCCGSTAATSTSSSPTSGQATTARGVLPLPFDAAVEANS